MLIQNRTLKLRVQCYLFVLAFTLSQCLASAQGVSHVIVVVGDKTPRGNRPKQLITISEKNRAVVADLTAVRIFGGNSSTLAFLSVVSAATPDNAWHFKCSLLVVDAMTSVVITNVDASGIMPPMKAPLGQFMAVDTTRSVAYFPDFDPQAPASFGFCEVNWKTGMLQAHTNSYKDLSLPFTIATIPSGFAISFMDPMERSRLLTALFDTSTQAPRLLPLVYRYDKHPGIGKILFLPTVGLIQYSPNVFSWSTNTVLSTNLVRAQMTSASGLATNIIEHSKIIEQSQPAFFQLTDAFLSTNAVTPAGIPASEVDSKIFARNLDGKPCLIWGEKSDRESQDSAISKIIIFDWNSKRERLRKNLGTGTTTFQPTADGSKVYFLDLKDGKIKFLDVRSQTVKMFSNEPVPNPAGSTILFAY